MKQPIEGKPNLALRSASHQQQQNGPSGVHADVVGLSGVRPDVVTIVLGIMAYNPNQPGI